MKSLHLRSLAALAAGALLLAGCTENKPAQEGAASSGASGASNALNVTSTNDDCQVSAPPHPPATSHSPSRMMVPRSPNSTSWPPTGSVSSQSVRTFAPGATADLTVSLQPGDYFTACKPGMRGTNVGKTAFKVTGDPVELSGDDQALFDKAVQDYVDFVKNEVSALVPKTDEFAKAYMAGDDEKAKQMFASTRVHYERIEPIAEALGVLDPRIDYREINYLAEADQFKEDDPTFTEWLGFHRIEKDLWAPAADAVQPDGTSAMEGWSPSTPEDRKRIGEALIADVNKLQETVSDPNFIKDQGVSISTVSNGASGLLEEISTNKVTGEENWWSHYDLWDFQANLQGAKIAFDLVAPIAERKGEEGKALVAQINTEFGKLQSLLDQYGSLDAGYVLYDKVTSDQQKELSDQINATREPLSKLTATVLGIQ